MIDPPGRAWRCGLLGWALAALLVVTGCLFVGQAAAQTLIKLDKRHVKWGAVGYGIGAEVTYAYLREPLVDAEARNCRRMLPLARALQPSGIAHAAFDREVRKGFALWSDVADISFREVRNLAAAQIVIGAQAEPHGIAYANVTLGKRQSDTISQLTRSTICLNPQVAWTTIHDGDPATYHVRRVVAHEIGHAIGLDHDGPLGGLMGYRYVETATSPVAELSAADIVAVRALYGPLDTTPIQATAVRPYPMDRSADGAAAVATRALGAAATPPALP